MPKRAWLLERVLPGQMRRPLGLLSEEVEGCLTSTYAAALELMPHPTPGRDRLLELGAGHCKIAQVLRRQGWQVHTADLRKDWVAEAIALGFPASQLDLNEDLPFPDRAFDLVVMLEVIEHVVRAENALREIWRVLSPGGQLLLSTPNHAFYKSRLRALKGRPLGKEGEHYRFFVKVQLESLLAAAGFRILARNSSGHPPLLDGRWVRKLLRRKRVLYRIPERLESICAINFIWLTEQRG